MANTIQEPRKINGYSNGIVKEIDTKLQNCLEIITVLDLSHRNISMVDDLIKLPPNLSELCLAHNKLFEVPKIVLKISNLKILDVSHNCISHFDEVPNFCDTLEQFNIANNNLQAPPLWIWSHTPEKLQKLNISCNPNIINTLRKEELECILDCQTQITDIDIHNCGLKSNVKILSTFPCAKILKIGDTEYDYHGSNALIDLPRKGVDKCCDIEILNACNTHLYTVNSNIDIYRHLKHIDLSQNYMHSLPDEFCNLSNLVVCVLSGNKLLYLPDDIYKLTKLTMLLLDSNELCMLPENICKLESLNVLDLYDNYLNEVPCNIKNLEKVDYAQNYLEEPDDVEYMSKKEKIRVNYSNRLNGRKLEIIRSESEYDSDSSIDFNELSTDNESQKPTCELSISPEDWDSDEYWIPQYYNSVPTPVSPWISFVKKKIEEGNFCPMDAHTVSVIETVKYEKLSNPHNEYESDGQFDDYSDDDS